MKKAAAQELERYRHCHPIAVRNYEIDWQKIVHNGNYLLYFEVARVDYFRQVGMDLDQRTITGGTTIVVVRTELDHVAPATFGDRLDVRTRIISIGTSSIRCEAVMTFAGTDTLVARNVCVMVWLEEGTGTPMRVPEYFRERVRAYEGTQVDMTGEQRTP